ncbi:hypothetical protein GCM10020256_17330 [Streptomyces thermocoprophilus]
MIRVDTITELVDTGLLLARQPLPAGPRVAILGNSESLGVLTYDQCVAAGLRPHRPIDLTTAASAEDFRTALARALADDTCDAVVVTAIPAIGEGPPGDAELAEALRSAAEAVPGKPVLVVHVELGGLAEALSAAASTAPQAGAQPPEPRRVRPSQQLPPSNAPAEPAATEPAATGPRLIPAYPAAERAVRALAEAVRYAQWRREAAEPGRVPEYDDIDEKGAARLIGGLLARGQGLTLSTEATSELLGRYGIHVRPALPAPTPRRRRRRRPRPRLPGRRQGHRPAPAAPRRPGRRTPRPRRRGAAAAGVRRADGRVRQARRGPPRRAGDGTARRRHRRTVRDRPGGRSGAVVRTRRRRLPAPRRHGAPARPRHRPGRRLAGPFDPHRSAAVRLARLHPRGHPPPWRNCCCGCPAWSTTTPKWSPSPWNRWSSHPAA